MSRTDEPAESRRAREAGRARPERRLIGIPVSAGVAIGPVFGAAEPPAVVTRQKIQAADIEAETSRLDAAIVQSRKQLQKLRARLGVLPEDSQAEIAPLLDAYLQMIGPSRLVRGARRRIAEILVSAETAVLDESEAIADAILATPGDQDPAGRKRRAEEVREICRRLVRNLTHAPFRSFLALPEGAVLVTETLRPADAALLDPSRVAGVAVDEGGAEGHTAIMLRALGVPAVLGAAGLAHAVKPGDIVVVDGAAGTVVLNPSPVTLAAARRAVTAFARERARLGRLRRLPAVTEDGETIELQANLEIPAELPLIAQSGAAGIGLLRSEFLFMNRETLPDEAAQFETYRSVIEAMGGDPVTIRVLDWGGEKDIEALQGEGIVPEVADRNPALGLRGIRLLLRQTELFETQLAAILRAATAGPTRVLLPMVTTVGEVRTAREVFDRVVRRLRRRGERLPDPLPPLGIMIETPGAALSADALALEADFFAIGTNDLSMYTLAVDRGETDVADLYDPLHPAVLRLVQFATEAALRMRMPVSVCGEMAANPRLTPLLVGLGLRSFSMNASAVPRVKQAVRALNIDDCARFARKVMEQSDPAIIQEMVLGQSPGAASP
ncbi:phosphoenolpyruvate--protein phosphotransferase [Limobrevibacterium gyesilva]|uniref:Phosphoenolpyruvate-protein phosphotransferase n=1 Tax=Limobrevibacterium gyesilva TaxID=2991712 RepID=A0AA42CG51_9PROT|nr:phosphoenolpyruvate--protein phosphotransferase [Limobrevibacterium gyesilva]MCW3473657.1 phosphoenolpyruvate--protein phosphotransferase [Limobrevibacterium gyesilva]